MFTIELPPNVGFDLFDEPSVRTGMRKEVPGGATIELLPSRGSQTRSFPAAAAGLVFSIAVTGLTSVGYNLFSSYLYDKLKKRGVREVTINRRLVEVTPEGLRRELEETITVREG